MKRVSTAVLSAAMCLYVGSGVAFAEEEATDDLDATPVETYTCNYREGKGPADLKAVNDEWNDWMDEEGQNGYFAAIITPTYFGERLFDVGWLGAWTDGHAMGAGTDLWVTEGAEVGGRYNEVLDCSSHTGFVSLNLRQPPENDDESDNSFVLHFSNCSFKEDGTFEAFMEAQSEWNTYADEHGIVGGAWMMFPIWGESNNDYDFKYVNSEGDYTTMGANWQKFSDGHWKKSSELFDDLIDCDIGRVYGATAIRNIEDED